MAVEFDHSACPTDTAAFGGAGKVVELNVFKKISPNIDEDVPPTPVDHHGSSVILTMSMLEEIQQARFRETRRLKRVEALEREIRVARAQNDALRAALEIAVEATRPVAGATAADGATLPTPAPQSQLSEQAARRARVPTLSRFLVRLLQRRR